MSGEPTVLTCHRCGSADLSLSEVCEEIASWDHGLLLVNGAIEARGEANLTPGEIRAERNWIRCWACGHGWRPRRTFNGQYDPAISEVVTHRRDVAS